MLHGVPNITPHVENLQGPQTILELLTAKSTAVATPSLDDTC